MKKLCIIIVAALVVSCAMKQPVLESVLLPVSYTDKKTDEFIKSVVVKDFKREIIEAFPDIKNYEGSFFYQVVPAPSANQAIKRNAVIVTINGFDTWPQKEEFRQFLLNHLSEELAKQRKM